MVDMDMDMAFLFLPAGGRGVFGDQGSYYYLFHEGVMGVKDAASQALRILSSKR